MFEKVNPSHPDKIADRIAGAIVDLAYKENLNPKIAVEVLIGHDKCNIIVESNIKFTFSDIYDIVLRISNQPNIQVNYTRVSQDEHLADNQNDKIRCGDNGIFKGALMTSEQSLLTNIVNKIYEDYPYDGKYLIDNDKIIACQSNISNNDLKNYLDFPNYKIIMNPLGEWTGGINVDCGATNRKLGSDMGDSVTGGGLHGKDLSKADISLNIYCFLKAQAGIDWVDDPYELSCAIGDEYIDGKPYSEIVEIARNYIQEIGGFEKFAEWGLIRPIKI